MDLKLIKIGYWSGILAFTVNLLFAIAPLKKRLDLIQLGNLKIVLE